MSFRNVLDAICYKLKPEDFRPGCGREWIEEKIKEYKEKRKGKTRKSIIQYLKEFDEVPYQIIEFIEKKAIPRKAFIAISAVLISLVLWYVTYRICM